MTSTFGRNLRITLFGEAQGPAIGITCDGLPAGLPVDPSVMEKALLKRRAYGDWAEDIRPEDTPIILSGMTAGVTNGAPLTILLHNKNGSLAEAQGDPVFRPSHADYTAFAKLGGHHDIRSGGHFSGRLTAALVALGAVLQAALAEKGMIIGSHIAQCGDVRDEDFPETDEAELREQIERLQAMAFGVIDADKAAEMREIIDAAAAEGDSVGGTLETAVVGIPAGVGAPFFDSLESQLAHLLFSVPGVKGVEFGMGFGFAYLNGSEANDQWVCEDEQIRTKSNMSGGINGGITNGMPVIFRTVFRPTPSIAMKQQTVDPATKEEKELALTGHFDPAIFHRARVVVDSVAAIGLFDLLLERRKDLWN